MSLGVETGSAVARSIAFELERTMDLSDPWTDGTKLPPRGGHVTQALWIMKQQSGVGCARVPATNVRRELEHFRLSRVVAVGAIAVLTALHATAARASLGGDEASIAEDAAEWNGAVHARAEEKYVVYDIQLPSGSTIRQYATLDQRVFAVTWHGTRLPDMRRLLGNYFEIFRSAERRPRARHAPFVIERDDLVVHAGGRLRAVFGEAHVPAWVPAGVQAEMLP